MITIKQFYTICRGYRKSGSGEPLQFSEERKSLHIKLEAVAEKWKLRLSVGYQTQEKGSLTFLLLWNLGYRRAEYLVQDKQNSQFISWISSIEFKVQLISSNVGVYFQIREIILCILLIC